MFEYVYRLEQGEVSFDFLNEITRRAYFNGHVEFAATLQEVCLIMYNDPI
jgi:hypothetical protein